MNSIKVYISGALTNVPNLEELRSFYEDIDALCRDLGMEPYLPHKHSDPVLNPHLSPKEVYERDKKRVLSSDLVIAYVGVPSLGVGMEIAYADEHGIPVVLVYPEGTRVSRLVRGLPSHILIGEVRFTSQEDALSQIREILMEWLGKHKDNEIQGGRPRSSLLRLETGAGDILVPKSEVEDDKHLIEMLRELRQRGVVPKQVYVEAWEANHLKDCVHTVWPSVPVYIEYQE